MEEQTKTICEKLDEIKNIKSNISGAIEEKLSSSISDIPFSGYADKIREINNYDLSFITATESEILSGYIGSDKNGNKISGNYVPIESVEETEYYYCTRFIIKR